MPTRAEHLRIADRNEKAAAGNESQYPEWAVTMLFYAALHYVEAYWDVVYAAEGCQQHYDDHRTRREAVGRYLASIYGSYRRLEERAHQARYDGVAFGEQDVRDCRQRWLEPVRRHILREIQPRPKPS